MIAEMFQHGGLVIGQLLLAVICGGIIGLERETLDRPAGFRTHVLVCVGSTIYMLISVAVAGSGQYVDPGRIAAQVASGIGFLGAGTIIKQGSIVRGLTTAASLWAVAAIGLAAGYGVTGLYIALAGTLVVYLTLRSLKRLESLVDTKPDHLVHVTVTGSQVLLTQVRLLLASHGLEVTSITQGKLQGGLGEMTVIGRVATLDKIEEVLQLLSAQEGITEVRCEYH
ncbi:MAG: putative Mg(2+) transport ATPase [bacterium ADurb.Bin429]|nr:MAG: putative Mg(2+) transport ATPase [bacterium ADurb.Bin429]